MPNGEGAQERRVKALIEGARALILINGGAGVSLLAFVQAIWGKENAGTSFNGPLWRSSCSVRVLQWLPMV